MSRTHMCTRPGCWGAGSGPLFSGLQCDYCSVDVASDAVANPFGCHMGGMWGVGHNVHSGSTENRLTDTVNVDVLRHYSLLPLPAVVCVWCTILHRNACCGFFNPFWPHSTHLHCLSSRSRCYACDRLYFRCIWVAFSLCAMCTISLVPHPVAFAVPSITDLHGHRIDENEAFSFQ